jgi:hypothetical protein
MRMILLVGLGEVADPAREDTVSNEQVTPDPGFRA